MFFFFKNKNKIFLHKHLNSSAVLRRLYKRRVALYVPANNPMGNVLLNATLGQFAVNNLEFQRKFNDLSKHFGDDVPLQVQVSLLRNKAFELVVRNSAISFLLYEEFLVGLQLVDLLDEDEFLYFQICNLSTVFLVVRFLVKYFFPMFLVASLFKTVLSTLYSMHVNVFNDIQ